MKKFLSLVLALVMTMSLVTVANASFTDADAVNYDAAVDVISELGIVGGYADGSFNPKGTLTRQAAAKIICNIAVGPDAAADLAAAAAPFADVAADNQFAGYIAYCVNAGIISGYADGTFKPANTLTGYAFLKMLLTTIGYDQVAEGYVGSNAQVNILLDAKAEGLLKGFDGKFNGSKALTREEACLFALNALDVETVSYKDNGSNIVIGDVQITTGKVLNDARGDKLFEANFDMEKKEDAKNNTDALGRPAYTWYVDGEKVGTYADAADIVIENETKQGDLDDLFEDLTWKKGVAEVKAADTANGKVIEIFVNDDDEIYAVAEIEAKLLKAGTVKADKKATKDEDERYVTFAGKVVTADKDVTKGTEIDNFEAVWAAADEDKEAQWFLVVFDEDGEVFSVEIPETIEAAISRVKGGEIVAGGEKYLLACAASVSKDEVELTVGANGVVYAIEGTDPADLSDVIYVDACYETSTKWGKVVNAQIVNEENEIVEVVVDEEYAAGFYTYVINDDDEYELEPATLVGKGTAIEDDDTYVKVDGKNYFADDMAVVYISGTKGDLEVTVKEGAQNVTGELFVLAGDDKDVQTIYVLGEYKDPASEDYLYIADTSVVADVINNDGKAAKTYNAYIDGEKVEIMISNVKAGFWTYEVDEKTGEYKLVDGNNDYLNKTIEISKGKFVSCGTIDDATVSGEIIDLTEEGLYTLSDIDGWDGDAVVVSFIYDKDENEITTLFVDFA